MSRKCFIFSIIVVLLVCMTGCAPQNGETANSPTMEQILSESKTPSLEMLQEAGVRYVYDESGHQYELLREVRELNAALYVATYTTTGVAIPYQQVSLEPIESATLPEGKCYADDIGGEWYVDYQGTLYKCSESVKIVAVN